MAHYGYKYASDEGLPEVIPDTSPQALTNLEAQYKQHGEEERDKYPVVYDDAPKLPNNEAQAQEPPEALAASPNGSVPWEPFAAGEGTTDAPGTTSEKEETEPRICGLRRKVFFLLLLVALLVVAAAIGGGVGGGVAAARSRAASDAAASSSASTSSAKTTTYTPTSTTPGTTTTSTSVEASPTAQFLNNQTAGPADFYFQGFSGFNYTGNATKIYTEEGYYDLGMECISYVWLPKESNCCITFCMDHFNATGYWCQRRLQPLASGVFPRLHIFCDLSILNKTEYGTCS